MNYELEFLSNLYNKACSTPSDINQLLPVIKSYADECKHITEFGVSVGNSTTAFLMSLPKQLRSYDIQSFEELAEIGNLPYLLDIAKDLEIDFKFYNNSSIEIEIEPTDLLFVDTWHVYQQLITELNIHHSKVSKYILVHDTETFKYKDIRINHRNENSPKRGLMTAIEEFCENNRNWKIEKHYDYNNGLTVLSKINES